MSSTYSRVRVAMICLNDGHSYSVSIQSLEDCQSFSQRVVRDLSICTLHSSFIVEANGRQVRIGKSQLGSLLKDWAITRQVSARIHDDQAVCSILFDGQRLSIRSDEVEE